MKKQKNKKKTQKKKSPLPLIAAAAVLIALIGLSLFLILKKGGEKNPAVTDTDSRAPEATFAPPETASGDFSLGEGIRVVSVGRYAGYYPEDGSDEAVSGVAMVTVRNEGTKYVQLLSFTMKDDAGNEFAFRLTTLFPGDEMTVLETDKKQFDMSRKIVSVSNNGYALFASEPSLQGDVLRIFLSDRGITLENISGETVPAGKLYYKNQSDGILVGGITYSSSFPSLAPGEKTSLNPKHYSESGSRMMFITFSDQAE